MGRRRSVRPPDLTSLFDVLFLFVFVSLVNAGMSRRAADLAVAKATPAPPPPAAPPVIVHRDLPALRDHALAEIGASMAKRIEVVARVSADGALVRLDLPDRQVAVGVPLVERVADPDVGVRYLGDQRADVRLCRVVAHALAVADLRDYLVIVAPDAPLAASTHALVDGLRADADRCLVEDRGVAVIVDPIATPAPMPAPAPAPKQGVTP